MFVRRQYIFLDNHKCSKYKLNVIPAVEEGEVTFI